MGYHGWAEDIVQAYEVPDNARAVKTKVPVLTVQGKKDKIKEVPVKLPCYHTAPPWELIWDDLWLFVKKFYVLPFVVSPMFYHHGGKKHHPPLDQAWVPQWLQYGFINRAVTAFQRGFQRVVDPYFPSGEMDELYPSVGNLLCLSAHTVLIFTQLAFLASLPFVATLPFTLVLPYAIAFILINQVVCMPLNAGVKGGILTSQKIPGDEHWDNHADESWIFLNGVSVGCHWLQGNLNRLARTFHRPIIGVHNQTAGIIFDVIQCLLERCFYYGTIDTRACYALIAGALADDTKKKVVLILHSQGGLEGSIILDWLLSHCSRAHLKKLEIYTFGNAANHFNNPKIKEGYVVGHIEHYANDGDFVARWGATHFKSLVSRQEETGKKAHGPGVLGYLLGRCERQNSFNGRLFENKHTRGHLLNQHYLNRILPLNKTLTAVKEIEAEDGSFRPDARFWRGRAFHKYDNDSVAENSRLWKYVNGRTPDDVRYHRKVNGYHRDVNGYHRDVNGYY
ncbi:hypothetical protein AAL_05432 [Moelleriella libera RCEF 2490]|uniref:Uncharacterized protein n=1 Tax=Moelleriella libera RCEF 2490 TaxID=1081109 RepID=A0A168ABG1_9HYPO|nr:hypothetical protein AAL_05432 [Moelleriella libera RCEF 2490]